MKSTGTHIGIDLDNTIICYDQSFLKVAKDYNLIKESVDFSKPMLKEYLINSTNGQYNWEKLQGLVYGKEINQAKLFEGFVEFIDQINRLKHMKVTIISHKTVTAHHDPELTPLREMALSFLEKNNVLSTERIDIKQVHFCSSLDEKIERIRYFNCDVFIDDLIDVFNHKNFPKSCLAILFKGQNNSMITRHSWGEILNDFFG